MMIALMIMITFLVYVLLTLFVVWMTYKKYRTKKSLIIALLIMILIPTWDTIIGKPIYKYLCKNKAGIHIYKTVDNVEGFYIGDWSSNGYSKIPPLPHKGYEYVDYKEKESGKYYRSYWVDNNTSKDCIKISDKFYDKKIVKLYKSGKCIIKKEIPESEVSGLWEISKKEIHNYHLLYLKITSVYVEVIDPRTKEKYFTAKDYMVDNGWYDVSLSSGEKNSRDCIGLSGWDYSINEFFVIDAIRKEKWTLKRRIK